MNKDRLLSDRELRKKVDDYLTNSVILPKSNKDNITARLEGLLDLINTQKRLYAEMVVNIDTDVDIPEVLKKVYSDGYSKGYNDRTYENSYNSDDFRIAEAIAPAVAKVRSRYDKQYKTIRTERGLL